MTVRSLLSLAAAVAIGLAGTTHAQAPRSSAPKAPAVSNQQLADDVSLRIRASGVAAGAQVGLNTQDGLVEIYGAVRSQKQAELIVQLARTVPGVVKVETSFRLTANNDIQPANSVEPGPLSIPTAPAFGQAMPQEPLPLSTPAMPGYDMTGPKLPPYAWPSYAPYPNVSRVAYPQAYPYNAFPFIGPYYPFPKVPLGWRSVKLEWDDGHWYLGRLSTPHDYWRVKFW